jgi:hypothetical protein
MTWSALLEPVIRTAAVAPTACWARIVAGTNVSTMRISSDGTSKSTVTSWAVVVANDKSALSSSRGSSASKRIERRR